MRRSDAATHTWLAARGLLLNRCDDFYLQLTLVREAFDPEAIHDLRVASRRLREGIALFANCFRKKQLILLRQELKTLTGMLGAIRNTDEAILFFKSMQQEIGKSPATINMLEILQADRDQQRRALKRELKKLDPGALLGRMDEMCSNPRIFDPAAEGLFEPIITTLLAAIIARSAVLEELLPAALVEENVAAQHRLRIAVKRFRYRLEFLAPFATTGYKELYATVKGYQELLGTMHDLDVFAALATAMIPAVDCPEVVTAVIAARRQQLFAEFLLRNGTSPLDRLGDKVRSCCDQ